MLSLSRIPIIVQMLMGKVEGCNCDPGKYCGDDGSFFFISDYGEVLKRSSVSRARPHGLATRLHWPAVPSKSLVLSFRA